MTRLAFVVPAHGRFELSAVCLRQLARTCAELADHGIRATAVVVADDENLDVAANLGFATVCQQNEPFGRKWNDGIEYACRYLGADYVVPFGTDNWITADLVARQIPRRGGIGAHRVVTLVHESGRRAVTLRVSYHGGDGIRTFPAGMLEPLGWRPAEDDKRRAIDTSIFNRLTQRYGKAPRFEYTDLEPLQVVGFQSEDEQLNDYRSLRARFGGEERHDVWSWLRTAYPADAVAEVRAVFRAREVQPPERLTAVVAL